MIRKRSAVADADGRNHIARAAQRQQYEQTPKLFRRIAST
jgi:hypothetical protein